MINDIFSHHMKNPGATQLFCFPYLGGNDGSYSEFTKQFEDLDVYTAKPPGHVGSKMPLAHSISEVTEIYLQAMAEICGGDYILFGHSMGGIISYSLAHSIIEKELFAPPAALVLSACGCPLEFENKKYSDLPSKTLIDIVASYDAMPMEVLMDEELMDLLLPIFRADYEILESAARLAWRKIPVRACLFWGERDKVEPIGAVMKWADFLSDEIKVFPMKDAPHMFIHGMEKEIAGKAMAFMKKSVLT